MAAGLINASQLPFEGNSNNEEIMGMEEPPHRVCFKFGKPGHWQNK